MYQTTLKTHGISKRCFLSTAGQLCKDKKTFFHTDAAQAAGKIPIDVKDMNINLLSISGHKLYGPKGA
jgi:cysteine desulfurase